MRLSKDESKVLHRRIECARRFAKDQYHGEWDRAEKLYNGTHYDDLDVRVTYERVTTNYLYPAVETQVAAIAFRTPDFYVVPEKRAEEESVEVATDAISYEWRQSHAQEEAIRVARDCAIGGIGFQMTSWLFATADEEGEETGRSVGARPEIEGEPLDPTPSMGEPPAELPVPRRLVLEDRPYHKRIAPKEFWVDPECGSMLEEAEYCGYDERLPLVEVKRNPLYRNTRQLKGSAKNVEGYLPADLEALPEEEIPDDLRRVVLHHYWEKRRRIHVVMCDEHDKDLLVESWSHDHPRYPVRVLRVPGCEDKFWPVPPMLRVEHPQREINLARSVLATHVRQSSPKLQYRGRLSPRQLRQVEDARGLTIVELDGEELISPIAMPPVQPEIFATEQRAVQDLQWILGLNAYEAMQEPSKRLTEDEVAAIQQQGGARGAAAKAGFEEFVSGLATDTLSLLQQYAVRTRSLPIYNDEGKVVAFRDYTKEEIRGDYTVRVYVGSAAAPNRATAIQQMSYLFQSLPNAVTALMTAAQIGIDLRPVLARFLKTLPEMRDVDQIVPVGPAGAMPGLGSLTPPALAGGGPAAATTPGAAAGAAQSALPPGQPDTGGAIDLRGLLELMQQFSPDELAALVS